jgi:hypothetical protein
MCAYAVARRRSPKDERLDVRLSARAHIQIRIVLPQPANGFTAPKRRRNYIIRPFARSIIIIIIIIRKSCAVVRIHLFIVQLGARRRFGSTAAKKDLIAK